MRTEQAHDAPLALLLRARTANHDARELAARGEQLPNGAGAGCGEVGERRVYAAGDEGEHIREAEAAVRDRGEGARDGGGPAGERAHVVAEACEADRLEPAEAKDERGWGAEEEAVSTSTC
jgi:hypothetical protein